MMAEEVASSSGSPFFEVYGRRDPLPPTYTSKMTSHSRTANPFAIKMATPTRSLADSTDNKESRPLVAPPTFKLKATESSNDTTWISSSSSFMPKLISQPSLTFEADKSKPFTQRETCGTSSISSSTQKTLLRPSVLAVQTEKLKHVHSTDKDGNEAMSNSNLPEDSEVHKEAQSPICENNGKMVNPALSAIITTSFADSSGLASPAGASGVADNSVPLKSHSSDGSVPQGGTFVFGQNLHARALNYDERNTEKLTMQAASQNLTFKDAAEKKDEFATPGKEDQYDKLKNLTESAKEYESKQVKRKFEEVTVVTGEEEESNVLQMNCKLFAFNKSAMNWLERGRGILRLNDRECDGVIQSRVVMRTQGSLRVVLNTKVWPGMAVERPSQKTIRLTAIDPEGLKVYIIMAHPKDVEQLFSALDWRVTTLKSQEDNSNKTVDAKEDSTLEEAISSSGHLIDVSSNDSFIDSPRKRCRNLSYESRPDSSTESVHVVLLQ